jgi:hypothetical protein
LRLLEGQQRFGFRDIVTGDEFWFLQNYEHRQIWCLPGDEVPKRVSRTIATPKKMLTVFLGVDGVVFTGWLPDGERFNSDYFCIHVLQPLAEILYRGRDAHSAKPIVHFDNATLHRAARTEQCFVDSKFRHAPRPPYSPDISPCDFFLFEDLKTKLRGEEFEGMDALQARVEELLGQVTPDLMRRVYEHWIERLEQVISTNGDDVERQFFPY